MRRLLGVFSVLLGVFSVLTLSLSACTFGEQSSRGPATDPPPLVVRSAPPSALVPLLNPAHPQDSLAAVRTLVHATARTNEHLVVLCGAQNVLSSTAPAEVITARAPVPPPPL